VALGEEFMMRALPTAVERGGLMRCRLDHTAGRRTLLHPRWSLATKGAMAAARIRHASGRTAGQRGRYR
jgi:hypothetical protein